MTPNDIAELAAAATEREVEKMKSNPIVKKIVADLETNEEELHEDIHNLEAEIAARVDEIESQKAKIAELEAENESLKAEVAELKARPADTPKKRSAK